MCPFLVAFIEYYTLSVVVFLSFLGGIAELAPCDVCLNDEDLRQRLAMEYVTRGYSSCLARQLDRSLSIS